VSYGWVVVAASAAIICVGIGAFFSLGVFLVPIERATGWSRGAISTVALLNWVAMGVGSFCWGALSDRIGGRGVALAGGFLLGLGLVLASQAQVLFYTLALVFGIAYGGVMPLYALVTREFFGEKVMGTAYGAVFLISSLGMGVGSLAGGVIYDRMGAYAWLYVGSAALALMAAVLAFTFRRPAVLGGPVIAPAPAR